MCHFIYEISNSLHFWAVDLLEVTKSLCISGHWWVTNTSVWLNQIIDSQGGVTFVMIKDGKGRVIVLLLGSEFCGCSIHSFSLCFSLLSVPALSRKPRGEKEVFSSSRLTICIFHALKVKSVLCIKMYV